MTGRISVAPAVAGRTTRMRVCPVGPTGQTTSSICASASGIGCDCRSVRTLCAAAGLSWLSGGPPRLLMNACVVGSSAMDHLLDRWSPRVVYPFYKATDHSQAPHRVSLAVPVLTEGALDFLCFSTSCTPTDFSRRRRLLL